MEKQDDLTRLRVASETGYKIQSLKSNEGWKVLHAEIEKQIEAIKLKAVDPDMIGETSLLAANAGAHNALRSLLDLLEGHVQRGALAEGRLKEIDKLKREERKLGIHSKI